MRDPEKRLFSCNVNGEKGNRQHVCMGNECLISVTANVIKNVFAGVHFIVVSMYCFALMKPATS
jgi:hypothetical protein